MTAAKFKANKQDAPAEAGASCLFLADIAQQRNFIYSAMGNYLLFKTNLNMRMIISIPPTRTANG